MQLTPVVRKLVLTAHVITSVGWFGAVAAFLALAIAGCISRDAPVVRAAYLAMELTGWYVIVPFCFASFVSGLALSMGTAWGLIRHYWVVVKLVMIVPATLLLLLHVQPISELAHVAAQTTLSAGDLIRLRVELVAQAAAALVVLLAATLLSIYKPPGLTVYGWNKQFGSQ